MNQTSQAIPRPHAALLMATAVQVRESTLKIESGVTANIAAFTLDVIFRFLDPQRVKKKLRRETYELYVE